MVSTEQDIKKSVLDREQFGSKHQNALSKTESWCEIQYVQMIQSICSFYFYSFNYSKIQ